MRIQTNGSTPLPSSLKGRMHGEGGTWTVSGPTFRVSRIEEDGGECEAEASRRVARIPDAED